MFHAGRHAFPNVPESASIMSLKIVQISGKQNLWCFGSA